MVRRQDQAHLKNGSRWVLDEEVGLVRVEKFVVLPAVNDLGNVDRRLCSGADASEPDAENDALSSQCEATFRFRPILLCASLPVWK